MTGPAYPLAPRAGQNALGKFAIGWSPVGTISTVDVWDTVVSQYANSPIITGVIQSIAAALDATASYDAFFSSVWDISTAVGYGLDRWGRVLDINRTIPVVSAIPYFSVDDPVYGLDNPNAPVMLPTSPATQTTQVTLLDVDYRNLLMAKAALNIAPGSSSGIMGVLNTFFNNYESNVFVSDTNNTITSLFGLSVGLCGNAPSVVNLSILFNGIMTVNPPCVSVSYSVTTGNGPLFGLDCENAFVSGPDVGYIDASPVKYLISLT